MKTMRWLIVAAMLLGTVAYGQAHDRDQDKLGNRTGEPNEVGHPQYGSTPPDLTPGMRQNVLQLREQQEQAQQIRQTIQERIQNQAQDRPDRPDQPERPDRPEQPEQPDRPYRPDRPERVTPGDGGAGSDDAATRRKQLMEQVHR